jgi:lipopolysaccharide export system permease protein
MPGSQLVVPGAQTKVPGAQPGVDSVQSAKTQEAIAAQAAAELMRSMKPANAVVPVGGAAGVVLNARLQEAQIRLDMAQHARNRYDIEIHKKFSLAAACLIFCILAPPIALRFPRGGVGLVIGVSLAVFAIYYVGLIGGEAAANKGLVEPFWAMWGTNVIMTLVGLVMLLRVGRDSSSGRGGGLREWLDTRRLLRDERRAAEASKRRGVVA